MGDLDRVEEAIKTALEYLGEHAEIETSYGHFMGGDPRNFTPDPECSTEDERTAWETACDEWNKGYQKSVPGPHVSLDSKEPCDSKVFWKGEDGKTEGWATRSGFGLGVNIIENVEAQGVYKQLCDALQAVKALR